MGKARNEKPTEPPGLNNGHEHIWRFMGLLWDEFRELRSNGERRYQFLIGLHIATIAAIFGVKFL